MRLLKKPCCSASVEPPYYASRRCGWPVAVYRRRRWWCVRHAPKEVKRHG